MSGKPNILILIPGPKFQLQKMYGQRAELLSESFRGFILTSSEQDQIEQLQIADFYIESIVWDSENKLSDLKNLYQHAKQIIEQQKAKGEPIELVVTYEPTKLGLMGILLSRRAKCPLAVEINGDYFVNEFYCDIQSRLKRIVSRTFFTMNIFVVLLFARGIKLLHEKQLGSMRNFFARKVIRVFPDHTDISEFKPGEQQNMVLSAGYPFEIKGMDVLIEAFKQIAVRHPDWKLKIIGYVENWDTVKQYIGDYAQIEYHPPVFPEEMPEQMAAAKIFVLASRTEAMGRVLIESAACGVARIGSNVGGIPTVIEDGVDGLLFEKENVQELAGKIEKLINDEKYRHQLTAKAQDRFNESFSGHYQQQCTEFYQAVIRR